MYTSVGGSSGYAMCQHAQLGLHGDMPGLVLWQECYFLAVANFTALVLCPGPCSDMTGMATPPLCVTNTSVV